LQKNDISGAKSQQKEGKKNKEIKTLAHFPGKPSMCPAPKQLDNIKHNKKKKKTHTQCRVSSLSTPHNQTNKKI
jgi:hypothetical protein